MSDNDKLDLSKFNVHAPDEFALRHVAAGGFKEAIQSLLDAGAQIPTLDDLKNRAKPSDTERDRQDEDL